MKSRSTKGVTALRLAIIAGCLTIVGAATGAGMLNPVPATTPVAAQGVPIPDCNTWRSSSDKEQTAFVVGVANTFALDLAYVTKTRRPDLVPGDRAAKALANVSIADVKARITAWCDANPSKLNTPIIAIIWTEMVKPKLGT